MNTKTIEEFDSILAVKTDPKKWPIGAKESVDFLNTVIIQKRQHLSSNNWALPEGIREGVRSLLEDYEIEVKNFLEDDFDQRKMTLLIYKVITLADVGTANPSNIADGAATFTGMSGSVVFKSEFKKFLNIYSGFLLDRDVPNAFFSRRNLSPLSLLYSMYLGLDIVGYSKNEVTTAEGVKYTRAGFADHDLAHLRANHINDPGRTYNYLPIIQEVLPHILSVVTPQRISVAFLLAHEYPSMLADYRNAAIEKKSFESLKQMTENIKSIAASRMSNTDDLSSLLDDPTKFSDVAHVRNFVNEMELVLESVYTELKNKN